jgi:hypothetical protein
MLYRFSLWMLFLGVAAAAYGQGPWDIARTTIDGKPVAIEYGRPILKEQTIADLMKMLPPDRIWRAGAGAATILSTETDILIGGKRIPAGNYVLYVYCPESGDYALVINNELGELSKGVLPKALSDRSDRPYPHFMDYTMSVAKSEVARIPMKRITALRSAVLIYEFEPEGKGSLLTIRWGDQAWTVPFQPVE